MKYYLICFIGFMLLGMFSCGEERKETFTGLTEIEKKVLHAELIDTLRSEMYDFLVEFDSFYEMAFPPYGPYYPIVIKQNIHDKVMVNGKIKNGAIQTSILEHFTTNRMENINDDCPPFYWTYHKNQIERIASLKNEVVRMRKEGFTKEMIEFKKRQIQEAMEILNYLNIMKTKSLRTIDDRAHIQLEYSLKTQSDIVDCALCSYYELRNEVSQQYFKKDYLEVYYDFKKDKDTKSLLQMDALKWSYPIRVLDVPFMKENNMKNYLIPSRGIVPISLPIEQ